MTPSRNRRECDPRLQNEVSPFFQEGYPELASFAVASPTSSTSPRLFLWDRRVEQRYRRGDYRPILYNVFQIGLVLPAARRHRHRRHNLGAHKVAGIKRAIQAAGATLWHLPPSSPDLNPIEFCFAKRKALVRTARCRSRETHWPFLGTCLEHFSPDECRNYFRHCGYLAATRS